MYKDEEEVDVAVRSSATAEDLPEAAFAGQQGNLRLFFTQQILNACSHFVANKYVFLETFLHIVGEEQLLEACKKCMVGLPLFYSQNYFSHLTFYYLLSGFLVHG